MFNKNFLFTFMFICYSIPIIYIFLYYKNNKSISHIISNGTTNNTVLYPMIFMFIFTIMYEVKRNNLLSLIIIIFLIIGIIGVIFIDKYMHYIYAYIVFLSIILFMIYHTIIIYTNNILYNLVYINSLVALNIIENNNNDIFIQEILYIGIFALFYTILHFQ